MRRAWSLVRIGLLCWCLANGAAAAQSAPSSTYEEIVNGIGKMMYAFAWPTASYSHVRFGSADLRDGALVLTFRLFGKSALDDSVLWTDATLMVNGRGKVSYAWGANNAVVSKPGATARMLAAGLEQLSAEINRYSQGTYGTPASARPSQASYREKNGLFSLSVLPNYLITSESSGRAADGHRVFSTTLAARDAEHDGKNGWLSDGVRVSVHLPAEGHEWTADYQSRWSTGTVGSLVGGYDQYDVKGREDSVFAGGIQGTGLAVVGYSGKIREPEAAYLYVFASRYCLVSVELATPVSRYAAADALNGLFRKTFKTACGG